MPIDCGKPTSKCSQITTKKCANAYQYFLNNNEDESELKRIYLYSCKNAFHDICFGGDKYGINSAICTELLHAGEEGFAKHAMKSFFTKTLHAQGCAKIDKMVNEFAKQPRHAGENEYGRLWKFTHPSK